jgi:hypothetical protein
MTLFEFPPTSARTPLVATDLAMLFQNRNEDTQSPFVTEFFSDPLLVTIEAMSVLGPRPLHLATSVIDQLPVKENSYFVQKRKERIRI